MIKKINDIRKNYSIVEVVLKNGLRFYEVEGVCCNDYEYKEEDVIRVIPRANSDELNRAIVYVDKHNNHNEGNARRKIVKKYDKSSGGLIKYYTSMKDVSEELGIEYHEFCIKLKYGYRDIGDYYFEVIGESGYSSENVVEDHFEELRGSGLGVSKSVIARYRKNDESEYLALYENVVDASLSSGVSIKYMQDELRKGKVEVGRYVYKTIKK